MPSSREVEYTRSDAHIPPSNGTVHRGTLQQNGYDAMVARENHTEGRTKQTAAGLWLTWRTLITTVFRTSSSTAVSAQKEISDRTRSAVQAAGETVSVARDPFVLDPVRSVQLASWTGLIALGVGIALRIGVGGINGHAVGSAAMTVGWAVARLLLLRLAPHARSDEHSTLKIAWGFGLLPYALAATGGIRTVAWVVSAWLTRRTAIRTGVDPQRATRLVLFAWGAQALFAILGWTARSAGMVLLGSLG